MPEILALKLGSRILGQWSNTVSSSRKTQASFPWAKQHRVYPVPSWRNHVQGWMNVQESYSPALEQGTLTNARDGCLRPRFSPIKPPPQIKLSKGQCDSLCGPPLVLHAHESTIAGLLRRLSPLLPPHWGPIPLRRILSWSAETQKVELLEILGEDQKISWAR